MKRKYLKMLILFATALTVMQVTARSSITYTADYSNRLYYGTDTLGGVTYSTVNYTGLFNGGEPGMPSLPIDYIRFSVPYNATNFTVSTTTSLDPIVPPLEYLIYPCQVPRLMNDTTPIVITLPDSAAYSSNYPQQRAWVESEGFLAGENHIVTVGVMPAKSICRTIFGSLTRTISAPQTINVTLSYDLSDTPSIYPIVRKDSTLRQEGYRFTRGMVVNPDSVIAFAPVNLTTDSIIFIDKKSHDGSSPSFLPIDSTGISHEEPYDTIPGVLYYEEYPYLIITTSALKPFLSRFIAIKELLGYRVNLVTLEQIYNHRIASQGDIEYGQNNVVITDTTDVGKIRRYLKLAYATQNTKYVLLAGNDIPYKIENGIATDWYYYDLNSNKATGKCDIYPDLFVGRLIAKSSEQISNYTDKVFRYSFNPGNGDYTYLKKAIVTEGKNLDSDSTFHETVLDTMRTVFPNITYLKEIDNSEFPKGSDVIDSININHYAFICSLNHGSKTAIKVYGPDSQDKNYYIWALDKTKYYFDTENGNSLDNLQNKNYPMIYYSLCCSTIPYGYSGTSFAESFITGKDYGGPVYIGNTTTVFENGINEVFKLFLKLLNTANYKAGVAYSLSKKGNDGTYFNRNTQNALAHNYIGDPTIDIWTELPQSFSNVVVSRGDSVINISGIGIDSIIVAIHGNKPSDKVILKTVTTPNISFNRISANSSVMLYKHNYIPYIAPLILQNITLSRSQYVIASDVTAGKAIDINRTSGDVSIPSGVEYEIEAYGNVRLEDGFKVEKGATFAVYPSSF